MIYMRIFKILRDILELCTCMPISVTSDRAKKEMRQSTYTTGRTKAAYHNAWAATSSGKGNLLAE